MSSGDAPPGPVTKPPGRSGGDSELLPLPPGHRRILTAFVRIDGVMCFARRSKMISSVRNIGRIMQSITRDVGFTFDRADFDSDLCVLLGLCPDLFELRRVSQSSDLHAAETLLCTSNGAEPAESSLKVDPDLVLVYKKHKGIGSGSISARYKIVFDALLSSVMASHEEFLRTLSSAQEQAHDNNGAPSIEVSHGKRKKQRHDIDGIKGELSHREDGVVNGRCAWNYSRQGWHPDFPLEGAKLPAQLAFSINDEDAKASAATSQIQVSQVPSARPAIPKSMQFLVDTSSYCGQMVYCSSYAARSAAYADLEAGIVDERVLAAASACLRVSRLYRHQAAGIKAAITGHDVIVATPTASGKSCIFLLPIFHSILSAISLSATLAIEVLPTALLLFPTKALANDQMVAIRCMHQTLGLGDGELSLAFGALDGDADAVSRQQLCESGVVLTSNPDMLHASVLPQHAKWKRFLGNLKYVVVDEAHVYNGIFGCNVALILRRLFRICHFYGARPQIIAASATISNPVEHMNLLFPLKALRTACNGRPRDLELVDESQDGAPSALRHVILWNPPVVFRGGHEASVEGWSDESVELALSTAVGPDYFGDGFRTPHVLPFHRNALGEIAKLLASLMAARKRTIAFAKSRKSAEYLLERTRGAIAELGLPSHLQFRVASYRGGYEKQDRRDIEVKLRNGELLAVVATNALELGIDVGSLDATLHLGVPESITSLRQQIGRCGRAGNESVSIIVCTNSPTDQFVARHPESIFARKYNVSSMNYEEETLLCRHLLCAAAELPLNPASSFESELWGGAAQGALDNLEQARKLVQRPSGFVPCETADVASSVRFNIRAKEEDNFRIIDAITKQVVDNMAFSRIFFEAFEGAIYLNQGRMYRVSRLDFQLKFALLEPISRIPSYTVKISESTSVTTHSVQSSRSLGECIMSANSSSSSETRQSLVYFGKVDVVRAAWRVVKQERISGRIIGEHDAAMPPLLYSTSAVWIGVPSAIVADLSAVSVNFDFLGASHAAYHAITSAAEVIVRCSPRDVECLHQINPDKALTELVFFDGQIGGTGVSKQMYQHMDEIMSTAIRILEECACGTHPLTPSGAARAEQGCLECALSLRCPMGNRDIHRRHGIYLLKYLLGTCM